MNLLSVISAETPIGKFSVNPRSPTYLYHTMSDATKCKDASIVLLFEVPYSNEAGQGGKVGMLDWVPH